MADYIQAVNKSLRIANLSTPSTLELKYLIHLIQEFSGQCKPGTSPLMLLMGCTQHGCWGNPQQQALTYFELEPFSRNGTPAQSACYRIGPVELLCHSSGLLKRISHAFSGADNQ